jgi:hypothetical protein
VFFKGVAMGSSAAAYFFEECSKISDRVYYVVMQEENLETLQRIRECHQRFLDEKYTNVVPVLFEDFVKMQFGSKAWWAAKEGFDRLNNDFLKISSVSIIPFCSPETFDSFKNQNVADAVTKIGSVQARDKLEQFSRNNAVFDEARFTSNLRKLLDDSSCSDSLTTSEWIYQKYWKSSDPDLASGFDFSSVVLGYFKCVEQFLWAILYSKGLGKEVDQQKGPHVKRVKLVPKHGSSEGIAANIGAMAHVFIDYYPNFGLSKDAGFALFREISDFGDFCHNGFTHQDNLQSSGVDTCRNQSLSLLYLLLGLLD